MSLTTSTEQSRPRNHREVLPFFREHSLLSVVEVAPKVRKIYGCFLESEHTPEAASIWPIYPYIYIEHCPDDTLTVQWSRLCSEDIVGSIDRGDFYGHSVIPNT